LHKRLPRLWGGPVYVALGGPERPGKTGPADEREAGWGFFAGPFPPETGRCRFGGGAQGLGSRPLKLLQVLDIHHSGTIWATQHTNISRLFPGIGVTPSGVGKRPTKF